MFFSYLPMECDLTRKKKRFIFKTQSYFFKIILFIYLFCVTCFIFDIKQDYKLLLLVNVF